MSKKAEQMTDLVSEASDINRGIRFGWDHGCNAVAGRPRKKDRTV
jgi:hypothetical protein